jgi:hypothetical protein
MECKKTVFYYQFVSFVFYRFLSVRIETGIFQKGRERRRRIRFHTMLQDLLANTIFLHFSSPFILSLPARYSDNISLMCLGSGSGSDESIELFLALLLFRRKVPVP